MSDNPVKYWWTFSKHDGRHTVYCMRTNKIRDYGDFDTSIKLSVINRQGESNAKVVVWKAKEG